MSLDAADVKQNCSMLLTAKYRVPVPHGKSWIF